MLGDSHEYKVMGLKSILQWTKTDEVKKIFDLMQKFENGKFIFNKKLKIYLIFWKKTYLTIDLIT